jgi:hypothetical protein
MKQQKKEKGLQSEKLPAAKLSYEQIHRLRGGDDPPPPPEPPPIDPIKK